MKDVKNEIKGKVNVTVHNGTINQKDYSYAKVQRNVALMGNVIDDVLEHNKNLDRATLFYAAELIKTSILNQLKNGKAVNVLELGTLYIKPTGAIEGASAKIENIPEMTTGFTPSEETLAAVKNIGVAGDVTMANLPEVTNIFDMHKEEVTDSISKGFTVRIKGDKLKIAGDEAGLFFVPCDSTGKKDEDEANWVQVKPTSFMDNTAKTLVFNVPSDIADGTYKLIIRTAYGSGSRINKSFRQGEYANIVTIS